MAAALKPAEIAGQKPAIDDGLQGEFRIIQIVRHHRLAARRHFPHTFSIRTQNSQFDSGQRLADRIGAERFEVVEREGGARFGETVTVDHGNAEIVEELQRRGFQECSAGNQRQQLSSKSPVHTGKQHAAELHIRPAARQDPINRNLGTQKRPLPGRQCVEFRPQAAFQVLYNHGNQRYIGDAITHKCIAHELRTQRAQMHHTSSAYERSDKTHHEVDRVIGRKNAQIPHARPKGIPRRQRATLFQIVLVGENASLRPAARAR